MDEKLEKLALWAKEKEIDALKKAQQAIQRKDESKYCYFDAKAMAFSQMWEKIVFDGRSVPARTLSPEEYNKANDEWSERIQDQT